MSKEPNFDCYVILIRTPLFVEFTEEEKMQCSPLALQELKDTFQN
jgi:hypothetical protein